MSKTKLKENGFRVNQYTDSSCPFGETPQANVSSRPSPCPGIQALASARPDHTRTGPGRWPGLQVFHQVTKVILWTWHPQGLAPNYRTKQVSTRSPERTFSSGPGFSCRGDLLFPSQGISPRVSFPGWPAPAESGLVLSDVTHRRPH